MALTLLLNTLIVHIIFHCSFCKKGLLKHVIIVVELFYAFDMVWIFLFVLVLLLYQFCISYSTKKQEIKVLRSCLKGCYDSTSLWLGYISDLKLICQHTISNTNNAIKTRLFISPIYCIDLHETVVIHDCNWECYYD